MWRVDTTKWEPIEVECKDGMDNHGFAVSPNTHFPTYVEAHQRLTAEVKILIKTSTENLKRAEQAYATAQKEAISAVTAFTIVMGKQHHQKKEAA